MIYPARLAREHHLTVHDLPALPLGSPLLLALLLPLESPVTLTLGVLLLLAFSLVGAFAVAEPGFLDGARD